MLRCGNFLTVLLLLSPAIRVARVPSEVPGFAAVLELSGGFDLLYEQKFAEGRQTFANWEVPNPEDPFGQVAVAASYLFEELYLQGVLNSDFLLNEKSRLPRSCSMEFTETGNSAWSKWPRLRSTVAICDLSPNPPCPCHVP